MAQKTVASRIDDAGPQRRMFILRELRSARGPRPLSGVCVTLASAALLAGAGFAVSTLLESIAPQGQLRFLGLRDEEAVLSLTLAGLVWIVFLIWLWAPMMRRSTPGDEQQRRHVRSFVRPILVSVGLAVAVAAALVALERGAVAWMRGDEFAPAAVVLLGAGGVLLAWVGRLRQIDRRFLAETPEGRIDLRCPRCDYSMRGLHAARCPECGAEFTIDELVRQQHYVARSAERNADSRCVHAVL